jgi:hypothetical protein
MDLHVVIDVRVIEFVSTMVGAVTAVAIVAWTVVKINRIC